MCVAFKIRRNIQRTNQRGAQHRVPHTRRHPEYDSSGCTPDQEDWRSWETDYLLNRVFFPLPTHTKITQNNAVLSVYSYGFSPGSVLTGPPVLLERGRKLPPGLHRHHQCVFLQSVVARHYSRVRFFPPVEMDGNQALPAQLRDVNKVLFRPQEGCSNACSFRQPSIKCLCFVDSHLWTGPFSLVTPINHYQAV